MEIEKKIIHSYVYKEGIKATEEVVRSSVISLQYQKMRDVIEGPHKDSEDIKYR